ncbi:unnamed protein product [Paramecium primaurelia]|uniref:Cyclic nucleotide-binding domain-containing protein n=1 Tax=Paramecium primaurelia TaxID=5886 RepID=A0A8S1PCQ2_PARPR|nr:unnamed protein product [Paramecium primaurelia]
MSKQNKTLIFDQAARHARIKKENEEHLSQTLKLYQEYGKIENNELIETVIDSLSTIEFFKQNCPEGMKLSEFVTNAIKYFQFEQYDYGQPIFHYGEYGDKMYIILKGEVGVFGPRPLDDINRDIEQVKKLEEIELVKVQKKQVTVNFDNLLKMQGDKYYKDGVLLYQKIFQYYSGQSFGDVALTSDKPRSASIIVYSEKAFCITMRRNDFKLIFQKSIQQARNTIDYFMKIFPGTLKFNISKFIQYLRPIVFHSKTILWQIGDEPQFFFIIVTGRVQLYKYFDRDTLMGKKKNQNLSYDKLYLSKQSNKQKIILSQLSDGSIIGQEELIEDLPQRKYCCEVVDNTNAYYMEQSDFRAIQGNHPDIMDCLRERIQINKDYINKRQRLILDNFKNYDDYLTSLNHNLNSQSQMKDLFLNINNKQICIRSQKNLKVSQNEILLQHIDYDQKRKSLEPEEESELRFIINNNNLQQIRDRFVRQQQNERECLSQQKQAHNRKLITQILKKYQYKKIQHEKKDRKRNSIFITSSQTSIGQTIETENSVEILRQQQMQRSSVIIPTHVKLRARKQSNQKSYNNNQTLVNLTEMESRTHQQTNITHITPSTCKFFKTIRSISGKC